MVGAKVRYFKIAATFKLTFSGDNIWCSQKKSLYVSITKIKHILNYIKISQKYYSCLIQNWCKLDTITTFTKTHPKKAILLFNQFFFCLNKLETNQFYVFFCNSSGNNRYIFLIIATPVALLGHYSINVEESLNIKKRCEIIWIYQKTYQIN